jgi:hypothetical protein
MPVTMFQGGSLGKGFLFWEKLFFTARVVPLHRDEFLEHHKKI